MIVGITGDRHKPFVVETTSALGLLDPERDFVVLGDCPTGVDPQAAAVSELLHLPHKAYEADWKKLGKAAGPIRNREMLNHPIDMLWYFHDDLDNSKGTKNCVNQALDRGLPVYDGRMLKLLITVVTGWPESSSTP